MSYQSSSGGAALRSLYYDPATGFISARELYDKAKEQDPSVTLRQVQELVTNQVPQQLTKATRRR
eukprot:29169-Eustigmatos_ZCMA.PRE.1